MAAQSIVTCSAKRWQQLERHSGLQLGCKPAYSYSYSSQHELAGGSCMVWWRPARDSHRQLLRGDGEARQQSGGSVKAGNAEWVWSLKQGGGGGGSQWGEGRWTARQRKSGSLTVVAKEGDLGANHTPSTMLLAPAMLRRHLWGEQRSTKQTMACQCQGVRGDILVGGNAGLQWRRC